METSTGVKLDPDFGLAPTITQHARKNLGKEWSAFAATHQDGRREYLLANGSEPVYASPQAESVLAHIDILALKTRSTFL